MKQLVQSVRSGELQLAEVPVPVIRDTEVLVRTHRSAVSPGTERSVRELASASLISKARARPDLVRQVLGRVRSDGLLSTARSVRSRLDDVMPLGYSGVGTVVEVGAHVSGIRPGMRVATAGAGHAEYQVVSGLLVARVPDGVSDENAAFGTVASVALHALRLAELGPASRVVVVGLGLVGQMACRIARASGYLVFGTDVLESAVAICRDSGFVAEVESGDRTSLDVLNWSRGGGADAVLITAGSASSEPLRRSTELVRDRANIVVVGAVGMDLDRRPFYDKELSLRVARSYGPGRYERSYEEWGVDYPQGYVRWTEGRNIEAVLDLLDGGALSFDDLVTHEVPFARALDAYESLSTPGETMGIQLTYDTEAGSVKRDPVMVSSARTRVKKTTRMRIGVVGAGNFVRATMLPALKEADIGDVMAICSATGTSALRLAKTYEIDQVHTDAFAMIEDPDLDSVFIATPHNTHSDLVISALRAGKHVFCEKPLCLTEDELIAIEQAHALSPGYLQVGFNRRHSPAFKAARAQIAGSGPLVINYRVNADQLPLSHWYHDRTQGGRLLGEVCHFIDTLIAIADEAALVKLDVAGSGQGEVQLDENLAISAAFENGVVGGITYGSHGNRSMSKESIEIVGRGRCVTIDNFDLVTVDGKTQRGFSGKGHAEQFAAFLAGTQSRKAPIAGRDATYASLLALGTLLGDSDRRT